MNISSPYKRILNKQCYFNSVSDPPKISIALLLEKLIRMRMKNDCEEN